MINHGKLDGKPLVIGINPCNYKEKESLNHVKLTFLSILSSFGFLALNLFVFLPLQLKPNVAFSHIRKQ